MFKKKIKVAIVALLSLMLLMPMSAFAANSYTVVSGDSLWKIAVKTQTGVSELIKENPQLENADLIYPGQKINVPTNDSYNMEQEVIKLVNVERANAGLSALKYDWELGRVAQYKSQDMHDKNYFSHTSPVYGTPFTMMKNFGISYKSAGENIAMGQKTAAAVVDAWMNSEGHRANILNKNYTHIGVGYVKDGNYWTQMFIQK
ncbi:LysM peptidoglycan-binding domain-containing protein [Psychrobacillus sp. AK 1817]|uniref:SafA/ExsA family spore coat assembly protein n=1 Tax=Psychrobacillus sp. AK 1817 TaxID=2303505 RepID=UPI00124861E8|nr:SafA/ExsA family spore coat assembly protein [Psychrobacillus sp. AK 1817]QEY21445.1 LysM peptidoglycan-binding domain-containing protein [Psychrobacillus sp. AK 1817]QGM31974.1 SafA/ExsA family spore coat assembly protein [Bacillus sp. N3536]